jgi:hypothetical protein
MTNEEVDTLAHAIWDIDINEADRRNVVWSIIGSELKLTAQQTASFLKIAEPDTNQEVIRYLQQQVSA